MVTREHQLQTQVCSRVLRETDCISSGHTTDILVLGRPSAASHFLPCLCKRITRKTVILQVAPFFTAGTRRTIVAKLCNRKPCHALQNGLGGGDKQIKKQKSREQGNKGTQFLQHITKVFFFLFFIAMVVLRSKHMKV